jgi:SAM-dependent methyltransferase
VEIHPWAERGFDRGAEAYERGRPGYAPEAVSFLVERLGLAAGRTVVDLGAGTGKLSRLLVASGARVIAVEPVRAMRELIGSRAIEVVAGTAEEIPLQAASADAVTVAQAFHWFRADETLAEVHRILRPGGALAVVRNRRDLSDPTQQAFQRILDAHRGHRPLEPELDVERALAGSGRFGAPELRSHAHAHELEAEGLVAQALSETSIALLDGDDRAAAEAAFRRLADNLPARFRLRYVTDVYAADRIP